MAILQVLGQLHIWWFIKIQIIQTSELYLSSFPCFYLRHLIFAPSSVDSYAGDEFPAVVDALYKIDDDPDQETRWNDVRKQLAILIFTIQSAASTLNEVTQL